MTKEGKSVRIPQPIAVLRTREFIDYNKAAVYFKVERTSISKRARGLTRNKEKANSFYFQCLTNKQKKVLIGYINTLTDQEMPLTRYIVKNLVEEIKEIEISKN